MHERKLSQATYPLVRRWRTRRIRRPHANLLLVGGLQDRIGVRRSHHLPEAHAEGEQVTYRDWSVRGYCVVERPVRTLQHLALGQFGKPAIHWLIQSQLAF